LSPWSIATNLTAAEASPRRLAEPARLVVEPEPSRLEGAPSLLVAEASPRRLAEPARPPAAEAGPRQKWALGRAAIR